MTTDRDTIIRMAREAKLLPEWVDLCQKDEDALVRFATLVVAAEREACAKVCDELAWDDAGWVSCAAAIRARSEA